MKKINLLSFIILIIFVISGCNQYKEEVIRDVPAVCISNTAYLYQNNIVLDSLQLGETVTYLDSKTLTIDSVSSIEYYLIRLKDEREFWARDSDFVLNSKAALVIKQRNIYRRPEKASKLEEQIPTGAFVAVFINTIKDRDDWVKIVQPMNGDHRDVWIKQYIDTDQKGDFVSGFSFEEVDVLIALELSPVRSEFKDIAKKKEKFEKILNNPEYRESKYLEELKKNYTTL